MMNNNRYDIVVIGGGAAGLMAGVRAVEGGYRVLIIDRLEKLGRKLLATGGGRCNLTRNLAIKEIILGYYGKKNFVRPALYDFPPEKVMEFFTSHGEECVVDSLGGVYPKSNKASRVLEVLSQAYLNRGGQVLAVSPVDEILVENESAIGVMVSGVKYLAKALIVATGGMSMEELGSDGSGFALLRKVGHKIIQPVPALVALVVNGLPSNDLAGVGLKNCLVRVRCKNKKAVEFVGDMLFTHKGVSGPVILNASSVISREIESGREFDVLVDWGGNELEWNERFDRWRKRGGSKSVDSVFGEFFVKRFVTYILKRAAVKEGTIIAELKRDEKDRLIAFLVGCKLEVTRTEGFRKSMVTSGGVDTKEINAKTLESKQVNGLYLCGEVIDVDGLCGGFNLQWAFASATLAVKAISK